MEPNEDKIGYYYTKSDISLMTIRVTLDEFSTTQILKKSFSEFRKNSFEDESGIRLQKFSGLEQNGNSIFHEEVTLKWQEKILSPSERRQLEKVKGGEDALDGDTLSFLRKGKKTARIFTYVDSDDYKKEELPPTTSKRESSPSTQLRNRFRHLRIQNSHQEDEIRVMWFYVMADLSPEESLGETSENDVVFCKIKYDVRGELLVDPDFSKRESKPYRITGVGKGSAIYEYTISFVSEKSEEEEFSALDIPPTVKTEKEFEFDKVGDSEIRVVFAGELMRATNFTHSSSPLYVIYQLYLPPGWKSEGNFPLEAMSESCVPIYDKNGTPVCHFSFPFNFSFRRSLTATGCPSLLLAVFYKEWLTHDIDGGFGVLQLSHPSHIMESETEVKMWCPTPSSPFEKLRRYFLGGVQLISDPSFVIPSQREKSLVSRLGFRTESSGSLWIRLHSALQINDKFASENLTEEKDLDKSYYHPSTMAVIRAFHKSFVRLKAAKANL